MLRWNTPSAICAIMITACPLTSFAQQIVTPAPPEISIFQKMPPLKMPGEIRKVAYQSPVPLVSPQAAVAANPTLRAPSAGSELRTASLSPLEPMPPIHLNDNPLSPPKSFNAKYRRPTTRPTTRPTVVAQAASPEIIIRTPFVQPHNPNNYLFVVENVGQIDATTAAVDLYVPDGVVIVGASPDTATSTARRVHVRLAGLAAGAKSIIEIQVQPTTDKVEFQTRLSSESVHKFTTAADPNFASRTISHTNPAASHPVSAIVAAVQPPNKPQTQTASLLKTIASPMVPRASVEAKQNVASVSPLMPLTPLSVEKTSPAQPAAANPENAAANIENAAANIESLIAQSSIDRTGKAQPPNIANAIANMSNAAPTTPVSTTTRTTTRTTAPATATTPNAMSHETTTPAATVSTTEATAEANLSATVDGPVTLNADEAAEYSITVTNPNTTDASDIVVQLTVPSGLKIIVLDRDAWFDEERQTISWEIVTLKPGQQETIQYRAIATTAGQQNQKVTVGMQNVYQGKAQLVTLISN